MGKDIQDRNLANPTGMLASAVLLLRHLGLDEHANAVTQGVLKVIAERKIMTKDMGGIASTTEFSNAVAKAIN